MPTGKFSDGGRTRRLGRLVGERFVVSADAAVGIRAHKLAAVLLGAVLLFMIGCTPGSSSSSSDSSNSSSTSAISQVTSNPTPVTGGRNDSVGSQMASSLTSVTGVTNDPASDPGPGELGGSSLAGDPGTDPPDNGSSASCPEPATGALFLCAVGAMALARLRRKELARS